MSGQMSKNPASATFGTRLMDIHGPYNSFVARCDRKWGGFEDADRKYRKQWLQDQAFSANDGKLRLYENPEYQKARFNIFRRIWQFPMNTFEFGLVRLGVHKNAAKYYRHSISMFGRLLFVAWAGTYYALYCKDDWTRFGGWRTYQSKPAIFPGHPEWPHHNSAKRYNPEDYSDRGYKNSPLYEKF